jgi:hypothetical protein
MTSRLAFFFLSSTYDWLNQLIRIHIYTIQVTKQIDMHPCLQSPSALTLKNKVKEKSRKPLLPGRTTFSAQDSYIHKATKHFKQTKHTQADSISSPYIQKCWSISELPTFPHQLKLLGWIGWCMQLNKKHKLCQMLLQAAMCLNRVME